jgi:hypothetical protein
MTRSRPALPDQRASVPARLFWLLPLVFLIHDSEELLTMPAWFAAHSAELEAFAARGRFAARIAATAPSTTARAAIAIGFVLVLLVVATLGVTVARGRGIWLYVYSGLLGLLFLHVFTHVAQALYFRSYVPGLFGAVLAVLPGAVLIYRRLFAAGLLTRRAAVATALAGFALFVPGVLAAWAIGRVLAG